MTLQEQARQARVRAAEYYQSEKRFGEVSINHAWSRESISILSDAQHLMSAGQLEEANELINMAKVLMIDAQGLEHPSERHRAEALADFQRDTSGLLD